MITTAPLPPFRSLLGLGRERLSPPQPWLRPGDTGWLLSRSCWSLALLAQVVASRRGCPPRIALPSWFCNASLGPLRQTGAKLQFLPVDSMGQADWSQAEDADMALLVHAFGHAVPSAAARAAAPILVEDCAHALVPAPGLGEAGDWVLYSPHKTLGAPEGAVMVRRHGEMEPGELPPAPSSGRWRVRRLIQSLLPDGLRSRLPQGGQPDMASDPEPGEPPPLTELSVLSRHLLASADLGREAARRRANALRLRRAITDLAGVSPFFPEDGPAPYRFVLRAESPERAEAVYAALRRARLPVESWPDLPPEACGTAVDLRRTLLLLPVHGGLPARFAERYAEALHGA